MNGMNAMLATLALLLSLQEAPDVTKVEHEVVWMVVEGGGHTLPHATAPFPEKLVGRTSRDIDGARIIWDFFARRLDLD